MAAVGLTATRSHDAEWLFFSVGRQISLSYEELQDSAEEFFPVSHTPHDCVLSVQATGADGFKQVLIQISGKLKGLGGANFPYSA